MNVQRPDGVDRDINSDKIPERNVLDASRGKRPLHNVQKKIDRLNRAYRLVKKVRAGLAVKKSHCDCCGLIKYADKAEWQMSQALDACLERLRKTAQELAKQLPEQKLPPP